MARRIAAAYQMEPLSALAAWSRRLAVFSLVATIVSVVIVRFGFLDFKPALTTFFGSLDGASKFVKGDAVAGLLITLLNLLVGLAVGVLAHDMPLGQAFETYAILTVGDGLVTQIPAVIISVASAILIAKGEPMARPIRPCWRSWAAIRWLWVRSQG